jgi:outer membrane lipoprotein-sorting protein
MIPRRADSRRAAPVFLVTLLVGIPSWSFAEADAQEGDLTPGQVLEKVGARYAALHSYHDRGEVLSYPPDKPGPDRIAFETFFERPSRFRLDWTSQHPYPPLRDLVTDHVIWFDGKGAFVYIDYPDGPDIYNREAGWRLALASTPGGPGGFSRTVFTILVPGERFGIPVTDLKEAVLLGSDTFEGVECYHLRGLLRERPAEVWIGKEDWLLRKITTRGYQDVLEEEIRRPHGADPQIAPEVFAFRPPKELGEPKVRVPGAQQ